MAKDDFRSTCLCGRKDHCDTPFQCGVGVAPKVKPTAPVRDSGWDPSPEAAAAEAIGCPAPKSDAVFRPAHYARLFPEPITVINAWGLGFNLGNAVKYIARAGHKDDREQDLRKAIRYLEIELECERRRKAAAAGADRMALVATL